MPAHKNQHFVPRCHLKPFSLDGEGTAINIYNRTQDRGIRNAPVKGQCSKDYFYGKDLKLEKLLQEIEGNYAATLAKIASGQSVEASHLSGLRTFAYLQMSRTEGTVKRRRDALEAMDEVTYRGKEQYRKTTPDIEHETLVKSSLALFTESIRHLSDLDVVILNNKTGRDFVTSDDPAVLTNRLHMQRRGGEPFGLISVGTQLSMPLTPRLALVCYDSTAYAAVGRNGPWINLTRVQDVLAFNELQHISCTSNVFFGNWDEFGAIRQDHLRASPHRPSQWTRLWVLALEWEDENGEFYHRATEEEIKDTTPKIIQNSPVYPHPSRWLSVLPMRQRTFGFTNGSAAGFVRPEQAKVMMARARGLVHQEIVYKPYDPAGPKTGYVAKSPR